jgi:hypothetical protein
LQRAGGEGSYPPYHAYFVASSGVFCAAPVFSVLEAFVIVDGETVAPVDVAYADMLRPDMTAGPAEGAEGTSGLFAPASFGTTAAEKNIHC